MGDDLARQSHAIFMQAMDVDASERDEFVRRSCAGSTELEARVRRLLAAIDGSTSFLDRPALGTRHRGAVHGAVAEPASIEVPGYRPLRVLGIGGMATVYEAVQEQPERTVALKVMSRGLDSASAARRFKYETEVLARLRHPGIAQIFEAGTCEDGAGRAIPFFAMELIPNARTITEHAADRNLSQRERLELFAGVCDAVQHGHQLGVIHRDLKPGNILVDEAGYTKVIDFGIARRVDPGSAGVTEKADAAQLIGTLNYMSPEQCGASLEVDARTDVYALGVVLFELLVGRLPHDLSGMPLAHAVRVIAEREAPRASSLQPGIARDLDAIIAKALNKDRSYRYTGADSLAADVRRFLKGLPVEARQPGSLELLVKMARRNRPLAVAVAMLALTLVVGITVSSWYAYVAARARDAAIAREKELEAVTSFQESLLRGVNAAEMGDQLRVSISERVKQASENGGAAAEDFTRLTEDVNFTSVAIQTLNESVLQRHRASIDAKFADQPRLRGRLLQQLADTMNSLGLHAEAEPVLRDALTVRRATLGDDHEDTLQTMHSLGSLLSTLGRQDAALAVLHETYERRSRTLGAENEYTLRTATSLGGAYRRKGDLKEAARIWGENLAIQRRTLGSDNPGTLRTLNNMGVVFAMQGKLAEAEACWRELIERRRLDGEDHPEYLSSRGNLGVILQQQGKFEQARPLMEQTVASDRRRFGDQHVNTLTSIAQLAIFMEDTEQFEEAEKLHRECYEGRLALLGSENAATLRAKAGLAFSMHKRGARVEGARIMREAIEVQRRSLGAEDPDAVRSLLQLAQMRRDEGGIEETLELEAEALKLGREHLKDEPWSIGEILSQHGQSLIKAGRLEEARKPLEEGYELIKASFGPGNLHAARAAKGMAAVCAAAGDEAEAARWTKRGE